MAPGPSRLRFGVEFHRGRFHPMFIRLLVAFTAVGVLTTRPAAAEPSNDHALTQRQKVVHAVNRLGYGPRAGDVERVERLGLDAWIEQQTHPERIDDAA